MRPGRSGPRKRIGTVGCARTRRVVQGPINAVFPQPALFENAAVVLTDVYSTPMNTIAHPANSSQTVALQIVSCPVCDGRDHRPERRIRDWQLVRCRSCGMVFANPQPSDEDLAAGYNGEGALTWAVGGHLDKTAFYETWFGSEDRRRWRKYLRGMARLCGGGRLLEYGCGPALVGQLAADEGWQVEAIDLGAWIRDLQPRRSFPLHVGTIRQQAWPPGCFDAVYAQDVLEHLRRPGEELRELARILRPGGVLFVHVPNYAAMTIRLGVSRFAYNEPPGHLNYFTPSTLRRVLRDAGFARVRLSSDHLEYRDFWRRGSFEYEAFEQQISQAGRPEHGPCWRAVRSLINIPLGVLRCGTYLWGYAVRSR